MAGAWLCTSALPLRATTGSPQIAAANISVVQNDASNNTASVTVSTTLSINDFRIRSGSNRADYDVQIGNASTNNVANGMLISSIDQNGRNNGEADFPGMNYGTCAIDSNASTSPGSSGQWWIPVFQAPQNAEYNFNAAAAYFPYTNGWYGGWLNNSAGSNGGANNQFIGNPNLILGTDVIALGGGKTTVNLLPFGLNSRSNAVLLVVGGKNEANFALSTANSNGTWTVFCHDDNVDGGTYEQDYIGFVCIPLTNQTVVSGKFMGNSSIAMQSAPFKVTNPGVGTYHLSIPGVNPANGVLIISAEGGGSENIDNIVSYQTNLDGWDIQTRDITFGFTPALQNLPASDAVVSFVYIPGPTPGSTETFWAGSPTNNWDKTGNDVWRMAGSSMLTNYSDGCLVIFDDTASNFVVNIATSASPYQVFVTSTWHNYVFNGSGSIIGSSGLIKQGGGKLTLNTTNNYTGNTMVSQGTLALGAAGCVPGGNGFGNVTVNGTMDLSGFSCILNNLSGNGIVDNLTAGGTILLTVNETASNSFAGSLKNTTGSLALTLEGGGVLSLNGANSFGDGCTVSNGTLAVNGSLGNGPVTVLANAGLAGTGNH
jgi:autotransporter-associated beta strand protein